MNQAMERIQYESFKINEEKGPELPRIFKHKANIKK